MLNKEILVHDKDDNFIAGVYISFPSTSAFVEFCSRLMTAFKHFVGKSHTNEIEREALGITLRLFSDAAKDGTALPASCNLSDYTSENYPPFILRLNRLYSVEYFLEEADGDAASLLYPEEFENGEITEFPKEFYLNREWKQADKLSSSLSNHLSLSHIWYNPTAEGDCYYAIV